MLDTAILDVAVDVAGVAAFVLSFTLAVLQIRSSLLRLKADDVVLVLPDAVPDSAFIHFVLINRTRVPVTVSAVQLLDGVSKRPIPAERTVRTYRFRGDGYKLPVGPVVLSTSFPLRLDSYAAEPVLLEVSRRSTDISNLRQGASACSPKGRAHWSPRAVRRICTPRSRPRLVIHTARGRRVVSVHVSSVQGWAWLEDYAVRKAASEGSVEFP